MSKASQSGAEHETSSSPEQYINEGEIKNTNKPRTAPAVVTPDDGFMKVNRKGTGFGKSSGSKEA